MKVGITQGINTWKSQPHICPVMLRTLLRTLQLNYRHYNGSPSVRIHARSTYSNDALVVLQNYVAGVQLYVPADPARLGITALV